MKDAAIAVIPQSEVQTLPADNSPMAAYQMILSQGGSLENIEKMMELQGKWEQMEAKKAYTQAMADFKANPPKINKDKRVSFNSTNYSHANWGS